MTIKWEVSALLTFEAEDYTGARAKLDEAKQSALAQGVIVKAVAADIGQADDERDPLTEVTDAGAGFEGSV